MYVQSYFALYDSLFSIKWSDEKTAAHQWKNKTRNCKISFLLVSKSNQANIFIYKKYAKLFNQYFFTLALLQILLASISTIFIIFSFKL